MQRHLAPIVHAHSDNVAYTLIYNGWDAVLGSHSQYWIENTWPGDANVDVLGFDMYNNYNVVRSGVLGTTMLDAMRYFRSVSTFGRGASESDGVMIRSCPGSMPALRAIVALTGSLSARSASNRPRVAVVSARLPGVFTSSELGMSTSTRVVAWAAGCSRLPKPGGASVTP